MTPNTAYLVDETRWLLSHRVHPLDVAKALKRSPVSLYQMSCRHNLADIHEAFAPYSKAGKK